MRPIRLPFMLVFGALKTQPQHRGRQAGAPDAGVIYDSSPYGRGVRSTSSSQGIDYVGEAAAHWPDAANPFTIHACFWSPEDSTPAAQAFGRHGGASNGWSLSASQSGTVSFSKIGVPVTQNFFSVYPSSSAGPNLINLTIVNGLDFKTSLYYNGYLHSTKSDTQAFISNAGETARLNENSSQTNFTSTFLFFAMWPRVEDG